MIDNRTLLHRASPARNGFALSVEQVFSNGRIHRLGHANDAIARLRPCRTVAYRKSRDPRPKDEGSLKTSVLTGIQEAKEKHANRHLFY